MQVDKSVERTAPDNSTDFDEIFDRLKLGAGIQSDTELSQVLGIRQSSISGAKKRKSLPPSWVTMISRQFGVSADWLLYGSGPMHRGNAQPTAPGPGKINPIPEGEPEWMAPEAAPKMGYTLVPKVRARLSAGTGSLEADGDVIGYYAFKTDFLQRKGCAGKMVLMDVAGDSMEPDIWNGDTVLIDESQQEIIAGGLFAVGIEQEVFVKYLLRVPGKLILKSKNNEYDPIEVDMNGEISGAVRIIGRVVWSCREYVR